MVCVETPEASLWIVGVLMSIAASTCTNLGVNMQKYSFIQEGKKSIKEKRGYIFQPWWATGLFLVIFGSLGDFAALGFAPQTLVTPVGGFTMVANVVFAHFFLKESFTKRDGIATGLIILGVIVVAAFADKGAKCYTLSELVALYGQPLFIVDIAMVVCICIVMIYLVKKIEGIVKTHGTSSLAYAKYKKIHPVLYPALSGIFGAQSVLLAKSTAELFKMSVEGSNQFKSVGTYIIALGMFACIFLQIHWLAAGLQSFDAVFVVPVFQCFFISTSIIGGIVYFDEFSTMSNVTIIMFMVGVALTLFGVFLLSKRDMTKLKPIMKFRSGVHCVIFIKRTQKAINHNYHWVQDAKPLDDSPQIRTGSKNVLKKQSSSAAVLPAKLAVAAVSVKYENESSSMLMPKSDTIGPK